MADPPEERRGLSPAAWGALSAVAVAVIGAAVTLTTAWWQHAPAPVAKPDTAASSAPAVAAAATTSGVVDPTAWVGAWKGTARTPDGQTFEVRVKLDGHCLAGAVCGSISVPHVPCTGHLSLVVARPDGAEFSVDDFDAASDREACKPGAGEVLKERPDGDLEYRATYSGARGLLHRTD